MEISKDQIQNAINAHFPGRTILDIKDRGEWVRHIVEVTLDDGEAVFFKVDIHNGEPGWFETQEGESHEQDVARILAAHNIHGVPPVLVVDDSREILPHTYVIQARVGGTRLGDLLDQATTAEAEDIYEAVGHYYRRLHNIHNEKYGIWMGSTPDQPWGDPPGYMYHAEIVEGSGKCALEQGHIT